MFGIEMLDVLIGVFFVYLLLSLVVTAANEMCAAWFARRSWMLWNGVRNLLDDDRLAEKLYEHPLIRSLRHEKGRPSYIPARTFAVAFLDIVPPQKNGQATEPKIVAQDSHVAASLAVLSAEAGGDREKLKEQIEIWFNNSMERVTGWYKRRTQLFLVMWAIVVTVGTNADTLAITNALWRDPALRESLVAQAQRYVAEQPRPGSGEQEAAPGPPPLPPYEQAEADFQAASAQVQDTLTELRAMTLPIGWRDRPERTSVGLDDGSLRLTTTEAADEWPGAIWPFDGNDEWKRWWAAFGEHKLGWLLTVLAVSLGAPFWFDTLNKIIALRGKKPEEEET